MKLIVETVGATQLIEGVTGHLISHNKPHVIPQTSFVTMRLAVRQLRKLAEVSDEATDEAFQKAISDAVEKNKGVKLDNAGFDKVIAAFVKDFSVDGGMSPEKSNVLGDPVDLVPVTTPKSADEANQTQTKGGTPAKADDSATKPAGASA